MAPIGDAPTMFFMSRKMQPENAKEETKWNEWMHKVSSSNVA
jgi:hypothetical protein